ncbi:MAG: methyltransferase domain-containing protein [Burkholderiales bacterium]
MIERIIKYYNDSDYDFRKFAFQGDPLKNRFEEWVGRYKMKWAIAKAIDAKIILEIGVGYGYAAHAFLDASRDAQYIGIDKPSLDGEVGAVDWAENFLSEQGFSAKILREDTQAWTRLPGGVFDLVHIDGQQDGNGTYHDLDLALVQSKTILVDGYHWTRQNFLAVNEWLWNNRAAVDYSTGIPGYAGGLLICPNSSALAVKGGSSNSTELVAAYTSDYYLRDCGGYEFWNDSRGARLDARLQAVADVACAIGKPKTVIDLGAGRGELSAFFARIGAHVTAIDYSPQATALIEKTLESSEDLKNRVTVVQGSVTDVSIYPEQADLAVAADVVEHLDPAELELMYAIVSDRLMSAKGSLVVHTAPNKWNYQYQHPKEQKAAIDAGFWLPRVRRTWYERQMHINEQNPRILKKQLSRYFPYVHLWFSDDHSAGGSLIRRFTVDDCRRAKSIFAIASHRPIDIKALAVSFISAPLTHEESEALEFSVVETPGSVRAGAIFHVAVNVVNRSSSRITSLLPHPYHLSYHWKSADGNMLIWEGQRTGFTPALTSGEERTYSVRVQAPVQQGKYRLEVAAVQEGVRWHEPIRAPSGGLIDIADGGKSAVLLST